MNALRQALRERTQPAHARLDGAFSELDLTCREDYARFLRAQAAAVTPIEAKLDSAGAGGLIPEWDDRKRAQSLVADLRVLGCTMPEPGNPVDWISDRASIIGAAYVMEGSRLGGKMLLKVVQGSPDPLVGRATAFLSHGAERRFWQSFDLMLADTELSAAETDLMVLSAEQTFGAFEAAARKILAAELLPA